MQWGWRYDASRSFQLGRSLRRDALTAAGPEFLALEGALEVARGHAVEAALELSVADYELAAGRRQPHAAPGGSFRGALDELEAGGFLELFQISPGVAIGHAELGCRLTEGTSLVDQLEQPRPAFAELESLAEDDPDPQLGLHGTTLYYGGAGLHQPSQLPDRGDRRSRRLIMSGKAYITGSSYVRIWAHAVRPKEPCNVSSVARPRHRAGPRPARRRSGAIHQRHPLDDHQHAGLWPARRPGAALRTQDRSLGEDDLRGHWQIGRAHV